MTIRRTKCVFAICAFLIICLAVSIFSTVVWGSQRRYEIRPEITLPEYKTDIQRVMDAYEHLMGNYIALTESHLSSTRTEIGNLTRKLDSIDRKIAELSIQVESIQKKLGIEPLDKPQQTTTRPKEAVQQP